MKYFVIATMSEGLTMGCYSSMEEAQAGMGDDALKVYGIMPMMSGNELDDDHLPNIEIYSDHARVTYKKDWTNWRIVEADESGRQCALYHEANGVDTDYKIYGSIIEARWAMEAAVTDMQQSDMQQSDMQQSDMQQSDMQQSDADWEVDRFDDSVEMYSLSEPVQRHAWWVVKLDEPIFGMV